MSLPVVRPLGAYEQYSSSRHSLGLYKNVITVCRYTHAEGATTLQHTIQRAVAAVVRDKLPGLRVGITGEATRAPAFVAVPSLAVSEHVECRDVVVEGGDDATAYDDRLLRTLEKETARPWADDIAAHPPWRVLVFSGPGWTDVAFAVHHALADGMSGLSFHTLLLEALNEGWDDDSDYRDVLTFVEPPQIVPPQEDLVPFTTSWSFLVRTLWRELGPGWPSWMPWPRWLSSSSVPYTGPPVSLDPALHGHLRGFHVAPPAAATLLAACRAHGVTLTALLHGLLLVLFARRVPEAATFSSLTPVSLRPYTAADRRPAWLTPAVLARSLSNLVSAFDYTFPEDVVGKARQPDDDNDAPVWQAATAFRTALQAYTSTLTRDNLSGLLGWVGDWHAYWRGQAGGVRDSTWGVSSLGAFDGTASTGPFRITRSFYTYSSMGKNEPISLTAGGVRGGGLSVLVLWHEGVVSEAFGEGIANDLRANIARFCETGQFGVVG